MLAIRAFRLWSAVAISARRSSVGCEASVSGGEDELAELHRLLREALEALPEEEHRLERLAAAPATELPGLVRALHAG